MNENAALKQRVQALAAAALERKAQKILALDVRAQTPFADAFLIANGESARQTRAIAEILLQRARQLGCNKLGAEGQEEGNWILLDWGEIIAHIFTPETRARYQLERLWSDAEEIPVEVSSPAAAGAAEVPA